MGRLRIELLEGVIDGVNDTFTIPVPYEPGTARYFLYGILRYGPDDDGIIETDPANGEIRVREPPLPGDRHQLLFEDLFIQGPSFNPIISFEVTFDLSTPSGVRCIDPNAISTPRAVNVDGVVNSPPGIPAGFLADEVNPPPVPPSGISFIDLNFVTTPRGLFVGAI